MELHSIYTSMSSLFFSIIILGFIQGAFKTIVCFKLVVRILFYKHIFKNLFLLEIIFFFFFLPLLWHAEVFGLYITSTTQQLPKPLH